MSGLAGSRLGAISIAEETANQLTHGFGLILSIVGAGVLIEAAKTHSDPLQFTGCCVYAGSLVALYAASTLSHSFQGARIRRAFRMLDQVCIFLLIAGTFTPFALSYFLQGWLWGLTLTMWGLSCVGIFFKVCIRGYQNVATSAYVLLGWIPVIAMHELARLLPLGGLLLIAAGGLLYTAGTYFLSNDEKVPYYHAVWHVFVVGASTCHFCAIMLYLIPRP
jgi:hemolysin III